MEEETDFYAAGHAAHFANPWADSEFDTIWGAFKYFCDTNNIHGDSLSFMLFSTGWDSIHEEEENNA